MSGGNNYIDELPMEVICDDLFDHIDDLLDFPNYDDFMLAGDATSENPFNTQCVVAPPPPLAPLQPSPPLKEFCDDIANAATVGSNNDNNKLLDDELDAAADLEWVSNFMDDTTDTFSLEFMPIDTTTTIKPDQFRTPSPISVLDPNCSLTTSGGAASSATTSSSSSYTSSSAGGSDSFNNKTNPILPLVPARAARSKRPRPAAFSVIRPIVAIPPQPESFGESTTTPQSTEIKKKKIKIKKYIPPYARIVNTASGEDVASAAIAAPAVRKCMHCEITKTPQWRAGPTGPKTLCNACGVRYKSGRLFPEYRPAASPTFVPTIHSNSHKKVVEMRISATYKPTPGMPSPESCDLLEYIRRRE